MSSMYGILDAIASEASNVHATAENIISEALEVVDHDKKILVILEDDEALREDLRAWAAGEGACEREESEMPVSPHEARKVHRERLMRELRSLTYARGHHEPFRHTLQDIRQLLSRLTRVCPTTVARAKEIQDALLGVSARLSTAWDRIGERVAAINMAQGIMTLGGHVDWEPDARRTYIPSDFCVSMLSQMWCAEQEIATLEPQLERAINMGDVVRASQLGGRIAGLRASLRLLASERPRPEPLLRITAW